MKKYLRNKWHQADLQQFIGRQLRFGVLLSITIALAGGLLLLLTRAGESAPDLTHFSSSAAAYTSFSTLTEGLLCADAEAVIQLSVICLIATPILRIIFSLLAFLIEGDRLYVGITFVVLAIILSNIYFGIK